MVIFLEYLPDDSDLKINAMLYALHSSFILNIYLHIQLHK